jgi:hypothetical protein
MGKVDINFEPGVLVKQKDFDDIGVVIDLFPRNKPFDAYVFWSKRTGGWYQIKDLERVDSD